MNILVLFANDYDVLFLNRKRFPKYTFFFEGNSNVISSLDKFCIVSFIKKLKKKYADIHAVICTQDYPGMLITAVLSYELGISNCSPEVTLRLQHKYYSRLLQKECLPNNTPKFDVISVDEVTDVKNISFPCFIKPVKSVFSFLASRIENRKQLQDFVCENKEQLKVFSKPFNDILSRFPEFCIDANHFIVEEILSGVQVTLDGFCCDGDVHIMGIVDSVKYPDRESFYSFEYPSKLPQNIQERMICMAKTFMSHANFEGMFNMEMFYNDNENTVDILEVNPRMFFAAADYFEKVDGVNTYETYLNLCLGKKPLLSKSNGKFSVAATFTPRLFEDKLVCRVPSEQEIEKLKIDFPDMILKIEHCAGQRLSDTVQSTGSYKYAVLNLGGSSWENLYDRYRKVLASLNFEFKDVTGSKNGGLIT